MKRSGKIRHDSCTADGYKFDSRKELERYRALRLLERGGAVTDLKVHPRYEIIPTLRSLDGRVIFRSAHYTADFSYKTPDGRLVVEDVKSEFTRREKDYILRRKLMLMVNGIYVEEVI